MCNIRVCKYFCLAWIRDAKAQGIGADGIATLEHLLTVVLQQANSPKETALLANYPNPFNPETWIPYQLAKPAEVMVSIHAADGKLIRTLALGQLPTGVYQDKDRAAYWDGKNEQGESVASGVYFYTLKAVISLPRKGCWFGSRFKGVGIRRYAVTKGQEVRLDFLPFPVSCRPAGAIDVGMSAFL